MTNSIQVSTHAGLTVTLSPMLDDRVHHVAGGVAYVRSEDDRASLVGELRAWGVPAAPTYVRVAR